MTRESPAERRKKVQEALREANVGCLLMFVLGVGLPLVAIGGVFVGLGVSGALTQERLNTTAVTAPATIVSSGTSGSTTRTGPGVGSTATSYFAAIEFEYRHEGVTRTSDRIWPVGEGGSAPEMRDVAQRYPAGREVIAFVDPTDHEVAFLEKRWSQMAYLAAFAGLGPLSFVATIGVVLAGWKRPGIALVLALGVACVIGGIGGALAAHYLQALPVADRAWWMWLVFAGGGVMAVGPLLGTLKARQLHRVLVSESD